MADKDGYFGQFRTPNAMSHHNAGHFHIDQQLGEARNGIPVKIIKVHGGDVGPPPTVDIQPIINQIDSEGNQTPHGIIYGLPAPRVQGGPNAIINDPQVGDVGHAIPSDRDHSTAHDNDWKQSNPGSFRRHHLSDMVYHPNRLNGGTPKHYLHFKSDNSSVELHYDANNYIKIDSNGITLVGGGVRVTLTATGLDIKDATVINQNKDIGFAHEHTKVVPGDGLTGPPR